MANPHKGEYAFKIDCRNEDVVLRFSADTICELEDKTGLTLNEISEQMRDPLKMRMKTVRDMFFASLSDRQPDMPQEEKALLFKALNPIEAVQHVAKAFGIAFGINEGEVENPPQPGAPLNGTGHVSMTTGAGSVSTRTGSGN